MKKLFALSLCMLMVSAATIDGYNDKFLMLAKGTITIQKFLEE